MQSKTDLIKTTLARGDWVSALRLASRFHDRSDDTMAFKRGFDEFQHREFYRQVGKDPDEQFTGNKTLGSILPITSIGRRDFKIPASVASGSGRLGRVAGGITSQRS